MNIQSVYSPSENAIYLSILYDDYVKAGTLPKDGVPISDEDAEQFNGGNKPNGKMLGVVDGALAWVDEPPRTPEQQKSDAANMKATLRAKADAEISWRQDAVDAGIATDEETSTLTQWKKYRVLLMRVDTSTAPDIEWPTPPAVQAR
ncbi:phage tail protein [Cronobacter sakazakii]|uniref:tail fiber assembly protein n=1 Tax=Cronobacter sakazakii TaxID=28141 RepID=UPI0009B99D59|nr:tail fiber assembly protein [Cronobacter sakazakii]PUX30702.1 phage tail protein [Cronobacter sakazakii]PUX42302.1 phage tail protein [Cronobacter sakazakii]PUY16626.1 phage tail protein [Cronobacter sakazakii]PUY16880.1 phage tail protein [Cronobacter sakazakii]